MNRKGFALNALSLLCFFLSLCIPTFAIPGDLPYVWNEAVPMLLGGFMKMRYFPDVRSQPDVLFEFTQAGNIAISLGQEKQSIRKSVNPVRLLTVNPATANQVYLYIKYDGLVYLNNVGTEMPISTTNPFTGGEEKGPFAAQLDFDRRLRLTNAEDEIVWEFPTRKINVTALDSYSLNYISTGDVLRSSNNQWCDKLQISKKESVDRIFCHGRIEKTYPLRHKTIEKRSCNSDNDLEKIMFGQGICVKLDKSDKQ
jgi:hypothetical protein